MPLFADTANAAGMNSLRMARRLPARKQQRRRPTVTSRRDEALRENIQVVQPDASALWQDWMRWRNPETAVTEFMEDLLVPEVLRGLGGSLSVNIGGPGTKPSADPINKQINIPIGTTPNDMRHELWHFTLQNLSQLAKRGVMPQSIKNLSPQYKIAARVGPQFIGEILSQFTGLHGLKNYLIDVNESGAISFGGAGAYPNLMPAFDPQDFGDIFNLNNPTWNY